MDSWLQDLRYAGRSLRKSPGFTAAAILTLAIGAAATLTMFILLDAVVVRPLPFRDAERLIGLHEHHPQRGWMAMTPANLRDVEQQTTCFESVGGVLVVDTNVRLGAEAARRVSVGRPGADIFPVLHADVVAGRAFTAGDFRDGASAAAIVSDALFADAFGRSPSAIGRVIDLDGRPYTIVGVAPPSLRVLGDVAVWAPIEDPAETWTDRQYHQFVGIGRLRAGVSLPAARAELETLARRLAHDHPATNTSWTFDASRLDDMILGTRVRPIVLTLSGAAILVLVLGCINVATLVTARAARRHREIAVRLALGCAPGRLVRELLIEGGLLSAAALGLAAAASRAVLPLLQTVPFSTDLPFQPSLRVDARFAVAVLGVFAAVTILAALAPAWRASGTDPRGGFHARASPAHPHGGATRALAAIQLAITIVLLASALVLLRSAERLATVPLGVAPDHVLMATIGLDERAYPTDSARAAYFDRLAESVRAVPGVMSVALANYAPLAAPGFNLRLTIEGRRAVESGDATSAPLATVNPEFFPTLRIPLVRGRLLDARDAATAPPVLVANASFARRFFGDRDPVGARVRLGLADDRWRTIVGIVGDVQSSRLDRGPESTLYAPVAQEPRAEVALVRVSGGDIGIAGAVRRAMVAADPSQAVSTMRPLQDLVRAAEDPWNVRAAMLSLFGVVALSLAAIGVYGVVSFAVAERTMEWGIRLALGAAPGRVVMDIVAAQAPVIAGGAIVGVTGAAAASALLSAYAFGVSPRDPLSLIVGAAVTATTAAVATYVPARRAARVDPIVALRTE